MNETLAQTEDAGAWTEKDARAARKFCFLFVLLVAAALSAIATANYLVNPHGQYATRWIDPMVQTSRAEKIHLLQAYENAPEALVLGSSRSMKYEPDYLESKLGLRFFNAGVNYAKPEDWLALTKFYQERFETFPKMIVIAMDIHSMTNGEPPDARLLVQPELAKHVSHLVSSGDLWRPWGSLIGWNQTKSTFKSLKRQLLPPESSGPIESFRSDGFLRYHQREAQISEGVYDFEGPLEYNKNEYLHYYNRYAGVSDVRKKALGEIIASCGANDCELLVFLTPLHPRLADYLREFGDFEARKADVQILMNQLSSKHGFMFRDYSDVASFGGDPSEFVDGIHPLESNTRLVIDQMLSERHLPEHEPASSNVRIDRQQAGKESHYAVQ
ncbi:MAG: hypothetical protein AAF483_22780 [Planctomycetota bacterium]